MMDLEQAKTEAIARLGKDEIERRETAFSLYQNSRAAYNAAVDYRTHKIADFVADLDNNDAELKKLREAYEAAEAEWQAAAQDGAPLLDYQYPTGDDEESEVEVVVTCKLTDAVVFHGDNVFHESDGSVILRAALPLPPLPEDLEIEVPRIAEEVPQ